ncbi:peptidase S41 [Lacticaseibacillus rhamnosus]|uniref:S41 family peptidase n=1 Tax=Lacticaseibacillus rhamnosus TaxID=47715 RepID=UPI00065ADA2B|nr:peptidase S41 [Lacticaseibacillus rhamnosus]OAU06758.1 peptidase S41 [Lacticaseibacillus rhamnosus]
MKAQEAIHINKHKVPLWAVIVLFLVALGGGAAGGYALSYQQAQQSVLKTGVPKALAPVISAYETVTNNYYKQVSTTKLTDGAIKGMLSSLDDPYSVYLQNNDKTNLDDTISASFGGIGATIQQDHNSLSIASILPGTPAKKAGMKVGDVLLKVNGKDVSKKTVTQAVAKIRGKIGTTVAVTVKRGSKQATFSMKRKKITVDTVTGKLAPANKQVGVITISTFSEPTVKQFKATVKKLRKEGAKSFILDLRQNPGGMMTAALSISSMFSKNGQTVMQIEDRNGAKEVYKAGKKLDGGFKVTEKTAVLIDGNSASASEITAAALHQNSQIPLVGEKSFGKGTVQNVGEMSSNKELKLTVAKWLTPDGTWINHKGLTPDVKVAYPAAAKITLINATQLKPGDKGSDVKSLQQMLKALKIGSATVNGQYDDATQAAVKSFQEANKLDASGTADQDTLAALAQKLSDQLTKDDPMVAAAVKEVMK